jgi:protoheme IX farnesyltransferase
LPPLIGWTAAGGSPLDPHVFALSFFFFVWQVPHFLLLLFVFGVEIEDAGLPALTKLFSMRQLGSIVFTWMLATFLSSLLIPLYLLTSSAWVNLGLLVCGLWLVSKASGVLRKVGWRGDLNQHIAAAHHVGPAGERANSRTLSDHRCSASQKHECARA